MAALVILVRVCGLGLLWPRLNAGLVCDDSAAEGGVHKCGAIYVNLNFTFLTFLALSYHRIIF